MGSIKPPNEIELDLDGPLIDRLRRYAAQRGVSFQQVLLQSVEAFLDDLHASEFDQPVKAAGKCLTEKGH